MERVSNAQRGRARLHGVVQSSAGLEVDDDRRKSLGEKGWARRAVVVRSVEPSGAAVFEAVPGREVYERGGREALSFHYPVWLQATKEAGAAGTCVLCKSVPVAC